MSEVINAISTYQTILAWSDTEGEEEQVVKIKTFPDLGGPPNMIEVTDLEDAMQTFIAGIQSSGEMAFTSNYLEEDYEAAIADEGEELYYTLSFGEDGEFGIFEWAGTHSVHITGGGVNDPVEMVITIAPATQPTLREEEEDD